MGDWRRRIFVCNWSVIFNLNILNRIRFIRAKWHSESNEAHYGLNLVLNGQMRLSNCLKMTTIFKSDSRKERSSPEPKKVFEVTCIQWRSQNFRGDPPLLDFFFNKKTLAILNNIFLFTAFFWKGGGGWKSINPYTWLRHSLFHIFHKYSKWIQKRVIFYQKLRP